MGPSGLGLNVILQLWPLGRWRHWRIENTVLEWVARLGPVIVVVEKPDHE